MVFIDYLIAAILGYGVLRGIWNGFFIELASLLSLIVGIWVAIKFSYVATAIIGGVVTWHPKTIQIIAFAVTFILVVIAITMLAKILTAAAKVAGLGLLNKIFGGIFGGIKMALILSVVLNIFVRVNFANLLVAKETTDKSLFYNPIIKTAANFYQTDRDLQ